MVDNLDFALMVAQVSLITIGIFTEGKTSKRMYDLIPLVASIQTIKFLKDKDGTS